jgi:methyl acetate hydrolase
LTVLQRRSVVVTTSFSCTSGSPKLRPAKRAITLRHLLTHTSGLTYSNRSDKLPQYEKSTGQADIAESKNGAFAAPLEFDPGDRWQYGIGMDGCRGQDRRGGQ